MGLGLTLRLLHSNKLGTFHAGKLLQRRERAVKLLQPRTVDSGCIYSNKCVVYEMAAVELFVCRILNFGREDLAGVFACQAAYLEDIRNEMT